MAGTWDRDDGREGKGSAFLYSPLIERAVRLAAQAHYGHFRKREPSTTLPSQPLDYPLPDDLVPYVTHLMGTTCILARLGARDEVLAAALLHDYLEDVPDPDGRDTIRRVVGDEVLELVLSVTENKRRECRASETWKVRKQEQIDAIAAVALDSVLIKAADMLHNLQSLIVDLDLAEHGDTIWNRFNAGPERLLWYYRNVLTACRDRLGDHQLLDELETTIDAVAEHIPSGGP